MIDCYGGRVSDEWRTLLSRPLLHRGEVPTGRWRRTMHCTCQLCDTEIEACNMDWPESNVDRLEEISEKLHYPPVLDPPQEMFRVMVPRGRCYYWGPQPHKKATCSQFMNTPGEFAPHSHREREWLIVYEGSMLLKVGDEPDRRLQVGDHAVIEPGVVHHARFDEECEYYAITVPATTDWGSQYAATQRDEATRGDASQPGPRVD